MLNSFLREHRICFGSTGTNSDILIDRNLGDIEKRSHCYGIINTVDGRNIGVVVRLGFTVVAQGLLWNNDRSHHEMASLTRSPLN